MIAQPVPASALWQRCLATAGRLLRRTLYASLLIALIGLAVALVSASGPRLLGYRTLAVHGGSMGESLPNGSLVVARWLATGDLELGQVIVIREESADGQARPRIHRVVSLEEEGGQLLVRTKGDANQTVDPGLWVLPDSVLTPAYTLPYLGYVVGFAASPLGWALFVLLPGAIICALTLRHIWAPERAPARAGAS